MGVVPGGTLTFLFTDIEGSTARWQEHPAAMQDALARHDSILAAACAGHGGHQFKHTGDGACMAFSSPSDAVAAAVAAQQALARDDWSGVGGLAVRMSVHTGEASQRDGDYFGPALNRAARIMDVAHGGQVLVSGVTADLLADAGPPDVSLVDLGEHRLRDLVEVERLHQVLAPGLGRDFPRVRSLDAFDHNLPLQRTSFVGRRTDVAELLDRLAKAPLVTLTGIGGAGKTRLALEAAAASLDRHPGGVFFVDLSGIGDGALVASTVAVALKLQHGASTSVTTADDLGKVLSFLSARRALLVIDNCEHLIDDCAELVDEVLAGCPDVTVLATSREPLALDGEHVFAVGSLPIDGADGDAVSLFHERAEAVSRDYDRSVHQASAVEICRRLDGIPLAIELAAAQVGVLAPGDVAARLDDRFAILTGGRRRVQRQQTLAATLDWSHDLLVETERVALRRAAVFAGAFTVSDAEVVLAGDDLPVEQVAATLARLVGKSLLTTVTDRRATRYRLLETVRMYALDKLAAAGEAVGARDRLVEALLNRLEARSIYDRSEDLEDALEVSNDVENLRAAQEWCETQGRLDLLARLIAGAFGFYWIEGHGEEALRWTVPALEATHLDDDVRSMVLQTHGVGLMFTGRMMEMQPSFEEAVTLARSDEVRWSAQCWAGFARMGDKARAFEMLDHVRRIEPTDDLARRWKGRAHFLSGAVCLFHRDLDQAVAELAAYESKDPRGQTARFLPVWKAAALALSGRLSEAREVAATAPRVESDVGGWWSYTGHWVSALIAAVSADADTTRRELEAAIAQIRRHWIPLAEEDCLLVLGTLAAHTGDPERANRLAGVVRGGAETAALRTPASYAVYGRLREWTTSQLEPEQLRASFESGRHTTVAEAIDVELARLSESASDPQS